MIPILRRQVGKRNRRVCKNIGANQPVCTVYQARRALSIALAAVSKAFFVFNAVERSEFAIFSRRCEGAAIPLDGIISRVGCGRKRIIKRDCAVVKRGTFSCRVGGVNDKLGCARIAFSVDCNVANRRMNSSCEVDAQNIICGNIYGLNC